MKSSGIVFFVAALLLTACPQPDETVDAGSSTGDAASAADGAQGDAGAAPLTEQEPNDGTTLDSYNDLPLDTTLQGALQQSDDVDIFRFDTTPGQLYVITLSPAMGSQLQPHLTLMDGGDGSAPAGDDYVKILRAAQGALVIELLALGHSDYYAVVRDSRNVGGAGGAGGPDHAYSLEVQAREPASATQGELSFPATEQGALAHAGAVALYSFEGFEWRDVIFDLQASGDMDGRLFVYSLVAQDWIARNDNRAADDPNPLIDAPLTEGGAMLLIVENIEEQATALGYTLVASQP